MYLLGYMNPPLYLDRPKPLPCKDLGQLGQARMYLLGNWFTRSTWGIGVRF